VGVAARHPRVAPSSTRSTRLDRLERRGGPQRALEHFHHRDRHTRSDGLRAPRGACLRHRLDYLAAQFRRLLMPCPGRLAAVRRCHRSRSTRGAVSEHGRGGRLAAVRTHAPTSQDLSCTDAELTSSTTNSISVGSASGVLPPPHGSGVSLISPHLARLGPSIGPGLGCYRIAGQVDADVSRRDHRWRCYHTAHAGSRCTGGCR